MPYFSVGYAEKERLEVELVGPPADRQTEGYEWIKGRVRIDVGAFKGEMEIDLCVSDMVRFQEQLTVVYENVKGVAEFTTIEDQLAIRIDVDMLGHVLASGYLRDDFVCGNKLHFNIRYDQTLLWHTIAEIDEALFELRKPR